MAAIDFGGQDYTQLTADLVAAQRAQRMFTVESREAKYDARVDGLNTVSRSLTALSTAASRVDSPLDYRSYSVTPDVAGYVNVTATGSRAPSDLNIQVLQVGRPDQALSSFGQAPDADLGSSSVTLSLGGSSFTVSQASGSLNDLAAAINADSSNPGLRATVIQDGANSAQLYLTSDNIGTSSTITLSGSGGVSGLGALDRTNFDAAQSAQIVVNGVSITSDESNTFDDAIAGLSIEAVKETTGVGDIPSQVSVDIARDVEDIIANVSSLVSAFNEVRGLLREGMDFDVDTRQAGALYGDGRAEQLEQKLVSALQTSYGLTGDNLSAASLIGIEVDQNGNLTLDEDKLRSTLESDFDSTVAIISGAPSGLGNETGLADTLKQLGDDFGGFAGVMAQQANTYQIKLDEIAKTKDRIENSLAGYEQLLTRQFASLQTLQGQLSGTSSFLESQFNNNSN